MADFGFARLVSEDPGATHVSTQVKGSAGYVDQITSGRFNFQTRVMFTLLVFCL